MGFDPVTALAVGGTAANAAGSFMGGRAQNREARRLRNDVRAQMWNAPSSAEQYLNSLVGANIPSFNTGQDALMQMLRAQPNMQANNALGAFLGTGNPFDTSAQFAALAPVENQMITDAVGGIRGRAGSLGQRFGSAGAGAEAMARTQLANQFALNRQNIASSAYEAAQGRQLGAAQALGQLQLGQAQQRSGLAQMLAQLGLAGTQAQAGIAQAAQGLEAQRRGLNAQLLGVRAGLPAAGSSAATGLGALGQGGIDLATLTMLMRGLGGGGGGATSFSPVNMPTFNIPGIQPTSGFNFY